MMLKMSVVRRSVSNLANPHFLFFEGWQRLLFAALLANVVWL
jgi:hypothetical protein